MGLFWNSLSSRDDAVENNDTGVCGSVFSPIDPPRFAGHPGLDGGELAEEGTSERRCQQAAIDIGCDEARRGQRFPEAERRLLIDQRIRDLEELDRWVEASVTLHRLQLELAFHDHDLAAERHRELIDTIERGNVVAKMVDFGQRHPFLAGFLGASLFDKIRKR